MVAWNYGEIQKCINRATITTSGSYNVTGGLVGHNAGIVKQCANYGQVTGYDTVGGVVAANYGVVEECYNVGKIHANLCSVAGTVGFNGNGANTQNAYIYNCYNNAEVTVGGARKTGGITGPSGYNNSNSYIYNCYTVKNTTIYHTNYGTTDARNNYTTDAKSKIKELNDGIDIVRRDKYDTALGRGYRKYKRRVSYISMAIGDIKLII